MKSATSTRITVRRLLVPVVSVAVIGALPAPAAACTQDSECFFSTCNTGTSTCQSLDVSRQDGALGFAITGTSFAGIGLLILPFGFDRNDKVRWSKIGMEVMLYGFGGLSALFGGLGVGYQASLSGPCGFKSECQITYGLGATSLGIGAAMIAGGIYVSAAPARLFGQGRATPSATSPWYAGIRPAPIVIPTARGAAVGVGISGINL